jgi:hypothetical protein
MAIGMYAAHNKRAVEALIEWTLTRRWALLSSVPFFKSDEYPSNRELSQLGRDLFFVTQATQGPVQGSKRKQLCFQLQKAAMQRWTNKRKSVNIDINQLNEQLAALKYMQTHGLLHPGQLNSSTDANDDDSDEIKTLNKWSEYKNWTHALREPKLQLPRINDFLLTPHRSEVAKRFLQLQRDIIAKDLGATGTYGSAWPLHDTPTTTPADHVTPVSWFNQGTRLIYEAADPAQLPAVVMCTREQNSAKSNNALGVFYASATHISHTFDPRNIKEDQLPMLARHIVWVFGLYPLIGNNNVNGITPSPSASKTGVPHYELSWEKGSFQKYMRGNVSTFERRIHLLTAAIEQWSVCNPAVFDLGCIDTEMCELLHRRFSGEEATVHLVVAALDAVASDAPR